MIKKLKRKFVIVSMSAVMVVLLLLLAAINIANYVNINKSANEKLDILAENKGRFPKKMKPRRDSMQREVEFSPEMPFETRHFSVTFNSNGTVEDVNTGHIAAITDDEAVKCAKEILESGKTKGFQDVYKYQISQNEGSIQIIFLDCNRDLDSFRSFLLSSIIILAIAFVSILILILFFAKSAIKPIVQSYEKQKRFITDASHEIKTPLTIIDANTEVLEIENGENEWTKSTKNQVHRLSTLTSKLVTLARLDEEGYKPPMEDIPISDLLAETMEPFIPIAEAQQKKLMIDIEPNLFIKGNANSLSELFSTLLENALKYSNHCADIVITLKKEGKHILFSVYNTAEHVPIGANNNLFERFYRGDDSRNSTTGGHGIGLSIAKAITELHGGKITAKSEDGESLHIIIYF